MIVGIPVLQLLLFGYAINQDVRHLRAGVADLAGHAARAASGAGRRSNPGGGRGRARAQRGGARDALARGPDPVGLLVPPDFERRVERGDRKPAQLLVDGSDPIVLAASRGIAELPVRARPAGVAAPDRDVRGARLLQPGAPLAGADRARA
jgi:ABC-2 type transport system permease protein